MRNCIYIKRVVFVVACMMVMCVTGCENGNSDNELTEEMTQVVYIPEAEQKIRDSIDKSYNEGVKKTELSSHRFILFPEETYGHSVSKNKDKNDNNYYGRYAIYTGKLIQDENVKSIQYTLSNCVGTFMNDSCTSSTLLNEYITQVESKPYLLEGNDQSGVYFVVYTCYDRNKSLNEQTTQLQECIKYLRITADITFEDGTKETRCYGITYISDTSSDVKGIRVWLME